jgi:hypothetical protein
MVAHRPRCIAPRQNSLKRHTAAKQIAKLAGLALGLLGPRVAVVMLLFLHMAMRLKTCNLLRLRSCPACPDPAQPIGWAFLLRLIFYNIRLNTHTAVVCHINRS